MLVHNGGQINNVQLITGLRIAEMSQLQNRSVKCTKNGSYCENVKKREKKSGGRGGCVQRMERGGGQGRCERKSEAFVKIQRKKKIFFFGGGRVRVGGGGGGVRVDVN